MTAARSPQPARLPPTLGPPGPGTRGEPCSPHARACTSHRRRKAGLLPAACPARQRGPILLPLRSADARHTPVPGAGRRRSQHELTRGGFRHHPVSNGETERLARGAGTGRGGLNPDRSCPGKPGAPMRHRKSVRPRPSAGAWGALLSPPPLAKGRAGGAARKLSCLPAPTRSPSGGLQGPRPERDGVPLPAPETRSGPAAPQLAQTEGDSPIRPWTPARPLTFVRP